jgi:hypothetical protein
MPPRVKNSRRAAPQQKNTLAFKSSRITKPGAAQSSIAKDASAKAAKLDTVPAVADIKEPAATPSPAPEDPETAEQELEPELQFPESLKPAPTIIATSESEESEQQAAKISDKQVKAYWQEKEDRRIFPRGR